MNKLKKLILKKIGKKSSLNPSLLKDGFEFDETKTKLYCFISIKQQFDQLQEFKISVENNQLIIIPKRITGQTTITSGNMTIIKVSYESYSVTIPLICHVEDGSDFHCSLKHNVLQVTLNKQVDKY